MVVLAAAVSTPTSATSNRCRAVAYDKRPMASPGASTGRRRSRGVSLLEMLLVLVLMAMIGLIAAMVMGGGMDGLRLRSSAKQLAAQLRYTRTQAIVSGVPQSFSIDPGSRRWEAANGRRGTLPLPLSVEFTGAREVQPQAHVGGIRFFEDGGSSGGRIDLHLRDAAWRVEVSWITGEVMLAPVLSGAVR